MFDSWIFDLGYPPGTGGGAGGWAPGIPGTYRALGLAGIPVPEGGGVTNPCANDPLWGGRNTAGYQASRGSVQKPGVLSPNPPLRRGDLHMHGRGASILG